jgi:hypothetical protein
MWFGSIMGYAQTTNYVYAYASDGNTNEILIQYINPQSGSRLSYESSLAKPADQALIYAIPSPNGEWIVFLFGNATQRDLILYNVQNDTQEPIAQLQADETVWLEFIYPQWSPNSRYITFLGRLLGDNQLYVHSYRVDFGLIESWGLQNELPGQFAWSPDSRLLAVSVTSCEGNPCQAFIRVYDIVAAGFYRTDEMEIANVPPCQLSWSPDNLHIIYQLACDFPTAISFAEIFLWDLEPDSTIQLTHFTNSPDAEVLQTYATTYTPAWYDAQTLIFGVNVSQPDFATGLTIEESVIIQTLAYNLSSASLTVLQNTFANEWAKNPVRNEIAYVDETISIVEGEYILQNAELQLGYFDGQQLVVTSSYPVGCELRWSPDGAYLVYFGVSNWISGSDRDCSDEAQRFIFVNNNSRTTLEIEPIATTGFHPIGWVITSP